MSTIPQVRASIRKVLEEAAKQAERKTGFIERERKFDGASFVQTLVFSWMGNPEATLDEMSQMANVLGVEVSRQGIDQRFTAEAAGLLYEVLQVTVKQAVQASPAEFDILNQFIGVYIVDSSTVQLPEALIEWWEGCGGGRKGQVNAGVKLSVRWDWLNGELTGLELHDARQHDQAAQVAACDLPAGSLRLTDLGYFNLKTFQHLERQGVFWLSRYKVGVQVENLAGKRLDLATWLEHQAADQVEMTVCLGNRIRVECRLVAQRLPAAVAAERREQLEKDAQREGYQLSPARWILAGWLILVTNIPADRLSFAQLFEVYRLRWQIELLFKLWKSEGLLDEWRTTNPWRILCEFYAKLIALLIQHWILITACWQRPERSLFQACRVVQRFAWALAFTLQIDPLFDLFLMVIQHCLSSGSQISKQQARPPTHQRLLAA